MGKKLLHDLVKAGIFVVLIGALVIYGNLQRFSTTVERNRAQVLSPTITPLDTLHTPEPSLSAEGNQAQASTKSCADIGKSAPPSFEVFVATECPFGLQMSRILVAIHQQNPSLINNVKMRYIDMHGPEEEKENLRQRCIEREEPDKFWTYVGCYIQKGESENCLKKTQIDVSKLNACISDPARGARYTTEDREQQTKYKVNASPTLILNGQEVSETWFGGRTQEAVKTALCCAFQQKPDTCTQQLTTNEATTGFSETYSE